MTEKYDPQSVEQFLTSLRHIEAGGCTEIRIFPKDRYLVQNGRREYVGNTVAGYYIDYAKASHDIAPFDGKGNIYATLNPCDPKLMRRAHNKLAFNVKATASDKDIISICWFPFDTDPVRPTNTPSSSEELVAALERRDQIRSEVFEPRGIPVICAMSGNGGHGLIRLPGYLNDDETQTKIKQLLDWLKETYSDDTVSVDSSIANPARIWKVYGTLACKGDNTPDAPYRRAFVDLPNAPFEPFDLLDIINQIVPANSGSGDAPAKNNQSRPRPMKNGTGTYPVLDVEKYLSHYGCSFRTKQKGDRTLYILNECPFNPNHNRGEVCITQETDGKLGFKCHHGSCGDKGWQEAKGVIGDPKPFYQGPSQPSKDASIDNWGTVDVPGHSSSNDANADDVTHKREKERLAKRAMSLRTTGARKQDIIIALLDDNKQSLDESVITGIVEEVIPSLKPRSARDIMTTEYPEPVWAIPDILTEGLTIFAGPSKIGKSWMVLDWSIAIACGGKALGSIDVERNPVLYCALEDNDRRLDQRLKILLPDGTIPDGLHFLTLGELPIMDKGGLDVLEEYLEVTPDIKVVFIDTWKKVKPMSSGRRNAYDEDYEMLGPLQQFAMKKGIALVVVHHTRKSADPDNIRNEISGSSGMQAPMDGIILLRREGGGFSLNVTGREVEEQDYAVSFDKGFWTFLGDAREHNVSDERKAILNLLAELEDPLSVADIAQMLNKSPGSIKFLCIKMAGEGLLSRPTRGKYVIPTTNATNATNTTNATNATIDVFSDNSSGKVAVDAPTTTIDDSSDSLRFSANGSDGSKGSKMSSEITFLKNCHAEFGNGPFNIEQAVRPAQTAEIDLTANNRSPQENLTIIAERLAGEEINGLKLRSLGEGEYVIATVAGGREELVI